MASLRDRQPSQSVAGYRYLPGLTFRCSAAARLFRQLKIEQSRTQAVAVRVQRERTRDPAAKRAFENKVQSRYCRQFVAHDIATDDAAEMLLHACGRHMLAQERIIVDGERRPTAARRARDGLGRQ